MNSINKHSGSWKLFLISFSITILWSCSPAGEQGGLESAEVVPVRLLPLKSEERSGAFFVSGTFTTDDETILSFKNGGVIEYIGVEEGDAVKKGQVLARVNPAELSAGLAQATLAYKKARRDFERAQGLFRDSVATREQVQNARTAMDLASEQLKSAQFNARFSEIRSTMDGYVLKRFVQTGQVVGPGTPVLMINGASQGNWMLKVGLSDSQWASVSEGDTAEVHSDLLPEGVAQAIVSHKPESIDPQSGTFTLTLTLQTNKNVHLASGAFARARIFPSRTMEGWSIPYDALLEGDQGRGYVFITNDKKTAEKVQVEISGIGKDHVEITSGLQDARYLIVSGSAYLNDGSDIRVVSDDSGTSSQK